MAKTEIIYPKNVRTKVAMNFTLVNQSASRTIEKMKILGANPAHLPQNLAKLAVLFSWLLQNGPQDFDFFQLPWVPIIHFM